jgi:hypothetical protein
VKRRPPPASVRPSWAAVADAVGHCLVVFAFVPTLAALPRWIGFELRNPFNAEDAIVLAFVPVRAAILLVNTFLAGVVQGVLAGVVAGATIAAWVRARGRPATWQQRLLLGAASGAIGACVMLLLLVAVEGVELRAGAVAFEAGSAAVCGMLAAPTAMRLLGRTPPDQRRGASADASQ